MTMVKVHVSLDKNHVEWFYEKFQGASISWWLNMLMEKSHEVMETSPSEYAKLAAEALKEELRT